ncbi:unnamed protein product [Owenia fusiformis]|uniref:Uncharacterized protein n=1 Tax=Owenia fusiformis TaxID=6347 RepID=A0A8J1XFC0_OWEFU|nr:unnamed protein product [Owenia fusiformis]
MMSCCAWSRRKKSDNVDTGNCDLLYEKDHGYAWMIALFSFSVHIFTYGISWSVGVFFVLFLNAFHTAKGVTAWPGSLNTATMYLVGPISSMLTNKFGCRPTVILGGVISAIGLGTSAFATNIYHLYITFGIVTGVGFGIAYLPGIVIVSQYFEKKRTLAIGVAASGIGFGSFIYPPMIDALNNQYGWRGALLMLSGITLNICVAGAFMRPFKITLLVPFLTHYGTLLAYSAIFGFCSAAFGILLPGIICQFLGSEELATGYGVLMTFEAVGTMLGGPAAGFMYDMLLSYNTSFFVGGGIIVISSLCMIVPYLREKRHGINTLEVVSNENENMLMEKGSNNAST